MINTPYKKTVAFLILCLLLGSPTISAQDKEETESKDSSAELQPNDTEVAQRVSVENVTADKAIQNRLTEIFQATEWFKELDVEVQDSVTFLNGVAIQNEHKEWAGSLARNTEGVVAVVNRIRVEKVIDVNNTMKVVTSSVTNLWKDFLYRLPLIIAGIIVLIVTLIISKLANLAASRIMRGSRLRVSLQDLLLQLLTIAIWLVGLLIAATIIFPGMTPSKALAFLGLGSVAVGFAFKDIFENFFAGILILWKYPFDKGDFISCQSLDGCIEDITIRNTMIRQVDGQLVIAPNAMLFKNPVDVLTSRPVRRTTIICGVAYGTDLETASKVLRSAVNRCPSVSFDQPVEVFSHEFADSSINFEITWWTGSKPLRIRESRDEVIRSIKVALDEANIEIPFPQRTLWFPEKLSLNSKSVPLD